jgi:nucleoside-diphosphate-sugar epimerase
MNILLTGCVGFIGAKMTELLLQAGHSITGIDNMNDYYDVRLKGWRLARLQLLNRFEFNLGDIEKLEFVRKVIRQHHFDAVVNLAARAGVPYSQENPFVYMTTNAMGTLNLLEAMREAGIKKFILASTSSLYAGQQIPFTETLPVNTPISPYAATKKAAEVMAYTYHYLYGIDVSICRYFTVYGPAGRPDMSLFRFIKWVMEDKELILYGDGSQRRDFTYVDDIAAGTIAALKPVGYEIFNLGRGDEPITLNTMISMIEKESGKQAIIKHEPFQITDIAETWADNSKARSMLDWQPHIDFETGLKNCVEWYRQNKTWLKDIKL